jgi:hypothetical protein
VLGDPRADQLLDRSLCPRHGSTVARAPNARNVSRCLISGRSLAAPY